MKKTILFISCLSLLCFSSAFTDDGSYIRDTLLIYENNFDETSDLDDWVIEGPGSISIENGQMRIQSKYAAQTQEFRDNGGSEDDQKDFVKKNSWWTI